MMWKQSPGGVLQNYFLKNFSKSTGKRLCRGLFFNKIARCSPATLLKKHTPTQAFSSEFGQIGKITFLIEHL